MMRCDSFKHRLSVLFMFTYLVSNVILVNVHRDYVITLICRNKNHNIHCFALSKRIMDNVAFLIICPCFKRVF